MMPAIVLALALTTPGDRPPECVTVPIHQAAGTAWVDMCGGAGGQESPLHLWAPRGGLVIDGFRVLIPPRKCTRQVPCVILAENAPPS